MEFLMRFGFLHKFFAPREESRGAARDRLRNALVGDRSSVAPALMDCLRADLLQVVARYADVDDKTLKVLIAERDAGMRLTATVDVLRVHRQAKLPAEALRDSAEATPSAEVRRAKRKLRGPRRGRFGSGEGSFEQV